MRLRTRLQILALEDRTTPAFYEGFDTVTPAALPAGWTTFTDIGPNLPAVTDEGTPSSRYAAQTPRNYAFLPQGRDVRGDRSLVSPVVAVPNDAGVQLKFFHSYFFFTSAPYLHSGGVLEIAINGGAFQDILAAGGSFASGGYNGTLSGGPLSSGWYNNPLAGRQAWGGQTTALGVVWNEVIVDLPAAARGQNVQFRWRIGTTDFANFGAGWYIDTVRVTAPAATMLGVSGGGQSAATGALFAQPLRVRVLDTAGNPAGGAPVTFTSPVAPGGLSHLVSFFLPSGVLASGTTVYTDADGYASVTVQANGIPGTGDVTATTPGVDTTATFTLTVTSGIGGTDGVGYAVGAGRGGGPRVKVFDRANAPRYDFFAYDPGFTGGVVVATGDLTGDGVRDIVTAPESGGGPHVKVYDGATGKEVRSFFAFDPAFVGGLTLAVGDVTGDAVIDIVVGAGPGGGPHVAAFDGKTGHIIRSFFAFDPGFRGGVSVAVGNGELVVAAGPGGGPHVRVFEQSSNTPVASFFAFDPAFVGGVNVTGMSSLFHTGEGIVAGQATGGSAVALFNKRGTRVGGEQPFGGFGGGARVAGTGLTLSDGPVLVEAAGPSGGPRVRGRRPVFTSDAQTAATFNEVFDFFPFEAAFRGGVNVG